MTLGILLLYYNLFLTYNGELTKIINYLHQSNYYMYFWIHRIFSYYTDEQNYFKD